MSDENIKQYASINTTWSKCSKGYAVYSKVVSLPIEGRLVIPGLKVSGKSTVSGKTDGLTIKTTYEKVENHVDKILGLISSETEKFEKITRQNIHEIRSINTSLYHTAYSLMDTTEIKRISEYSTLESEKIKNIMAFSQLLSVRFDVMGISTTDFINEFNTAQVAIYKKFKKIYKCFKSTAAKKNIQLTFSGKSLGLSEGPDIVEILAFLSIDNAIKYSPEHQECKIEIKEDEKTIEVKITNIGPKIENEEIEKLFTKGYRGKNARKSGANGTGLGLSILKSIVKDGFGGDFNIHQNENKTEIEKIPYHEISAHFSFPRYYS